MQEFAFSRTTGLRLVNAKCPGKGILTPAGRYDLSIMVSFVVIIFTVLLAADISQAATYYTATSGSDSNPGSQASPFRTIAKGISVLKAGDALYIRSGTYSESISSSPSGTSWSNAPLISAYQSEVATLQGYINLSGVQYVIFQNLVIDSRGNANEVVRLADGANHIRFTGCEIKNGAHMGVLTPHQADGYHEFINCNIHDNGTVASLDHGFYLSSSNNLIDGCRIHHNAAYGIQTYNGYSGESANNNVYRNNRVYSNGVLGASTTQFGILIGSGSNNVIYNNLIYKNTGGGIQISGGSNNRAYNNTVYGQVRQNYAVEVNSSGAIVRNNIIYNNEMNVISGSATQSNNLLVNPSFVNVATDDYHLQSGSPAIDTGAVVSEVPQDFDGIPRPQGASFDMGAHEYQSGQSQASAPSNLRIIP